MRSLLTLLLCSRIAYAWSETTYYQTSIAYGWANLTTATLTGAVKLLGYVTPTSTDITTTTAVYGPAIYPITVSNLWVGPDASVCTTYPLNSCTDTTTSTPTAAPTITTQYYAPVVISEPSSCTLTSFLYTTSYSVNADIDFHPIFVQQATESVEAVFVTTYVSTVSVDKGGQAVTTTKCDVYLRGDDMIIPTPLESSLLSQCVDPRRWMCSDQLLAYTGGCPTSVKSYPPTSTTYPPTSTTSPNQGKKSGSSKLRVWQFVLYGAVWLATGLLIC